MSLVSIVIPTFNGEATISETIDSVLSQEGVDFEVLIADQDSSDGTRTILDTYTRDGRVRIFDGPRNGGAAANWNFVTDQAKGKYLKLVCQDDLLLPGVLERQVALLETELSAVMTACKRDVTTESGQVLFRGRGLRGLNRPIEGRDAVEIGLSSGTNIFGEPACVLMRTQAFKEVGGWDGRWSYLIDLASYNRLLAQGVFVPDLTVGAQFKVSTGQWSVALRGSQSSEFRNYLTELQGQTSLSFGQILIAKIRSQVAELLRRCVYIAIPFLRKRGVE